MKLPEKRIADETPAAIDPDMFAAVF